MQKRWAFSDIREVHHDTGWFVTGGENRRYIYDGPLYLRLLTDGVWAFPGYAASSDAALNAYGATAIARCAPGKPTANLATALLEAWHDGLPKLIGQATWRDRIDKARHLQRTAATSGDEYLNYQFGILPLVSDVTDFLKTVAHMRKLQMQYERDCGQVVRRRYNFPSERQYTESIVENPSAPGMGPNDSFQLDNAVGVSRGYVVRGRETTVRRWFSGAFVYHIPLTYFAGLNSKFASNWQVAESLLGLDLTPETLWELTPWSWAVDWFSDIGDVIHNVSAWANGGLVMKYGYIMEHSIVRDTYTYVGPTNLRGQSTLRPPDAVLVSETKLRRKANPFGFGLTMAGLTTYQKSILAALGLSRLR